MYVRCLFIYTGIVQALIDNCKLIGRVPPDVCVASATCKSELHLQTTKSFEDIIEEEKDLPERYSKKKKKQRTASLSGEPQSQYKLMVMYTYKHASKCMTYLCCVCKLHEVLY